jgi:hypothetical protein
MTDHRLAYLDQATYLSQQATGRAQLTQLVWLYEHPVDHAGLKTFHQNFGYGLAGRRIERSALPFGRHRWVSSTGPATDLDIANGIRPRAELSDWIDERAQVPVDPESGPGWHLGVLSMSDGSTAVSLVGSHCLFDGVGVLQTVAQAANGVVRELDYPPPEAHARRRPRLREAVLTVREIGPAGRALLAGVRMALRRRRDSPQGPAAPARVGAVGDDTVVIPAISVFVDLADWDRAAERLGGNSYSMLAGYAAALAARIERCHPEHGKVALLIALSDRTEHDTRANALRFARVDVDPKGVSGDLSAARTAIRGALATLREVPDETFALLPLTPFIPKRAVRRMSTAVFGDLPVSCSNVGDLDPAVSRIDGTDAEYFLLRPVDQNLRRAEIERGGGHLVVVAGRIRGGMSIGVVAYQPGAVNTKARLAALATEVLGEFRLDGAVI